MKKTVFLYLCSMMLLTACHFDGLAISGINKIEPSDNIVKNEYPQPSFSKVNISVMANVKFIQGKEKDYRVVLSAPDNYVDLFRFKVDKDQLNVDFTRNNVTITTDNVDVTIYSPTLTKLENSGMASVETDRLKGERLELNNLGVGTLYMNGLKLNALDAECSGVGNIELEGTALEVRLETSGVGSIKAENLKGRDVEAEVSGVGNIVCHASNSIKGEVSGIGSLKYGGNPQAKKLNRSGVGSISPL